MLIVAELGESKEAAIMRVCGPQGLPQRAPEDGPHLTRPDCSMLSEGLSNWAN